MKKIFLSFFALTIGLLWCSTTTAQNVLLNEDFESVELDKGDGSLSYNLPEGWTKIDADEDPALPRKAQTNGTMVHITAIFGFALAGLVVQDIVRER